MSINYIPNDPIANSPPARVIEPHADRPAGRAGFNFAGIAPEGEFDPPSDEFLFWQCREAALRAIDVWETIDSNLDSWFGGRATLDLIPRVPGDNRLNAFYNRSSLSFFVNSNASRITQSGASTDVVAHEAGHAFLDMIRPDLFGSMFVEAGAFHESFGDCVAMLTALEDEQTRQLLLNGGGQLRSANFVETTAEDLSEGIRTVNPTHNAATARRGLNDFQWVMPGTLPTNGGPGALINEIHSFGMVFNGCFYDTISNIFAAGADHSHTGLLNASRLAGTLLAAGARSAPLTSRMFKAVGNAMVLADRDLNGGANEPSITTAFAGHGIDLDVAAMMVPTNILAGRAPRAAAASTADVITRASRRDLVAELGKAAGQKFFAQSRKMGSDDIYVARHRRHVPLDDVSERLQGVVAFVEDEVLLGESNGHAAVLGAVSTVNSSMVEVQSFVNSLMQNGQVALDDSDESEINVATHMIRKSGANRVLTRQQFNCRCGHHHGPCNLVR